MEAAGPPAPQAPVYVVDLLDLADRARERMGLAGYSDEAWTELFSWNKTDIAPNPGVAVNASRQILPGDVRSIGGWVLAETTGAAIAAFRLRDGNGPGGEVIARINLAANESTRDFVPRHGIRCSTGRVFIEMLAGSVEGVLFWR